MEKIILIWSLQDRALPVVLNDSGCPLGDPDLFDTGLADEEEEEEESLDAIRATVRMKMRNQEVEAGALLLPLLQVVSGSSD